MYRIMTEQHTYCTSCGKELFSADDAALCNRQHTLEQVARTEQGRRILDDLKAVAFIDRPDPWFRDTRR